MALPWVVLSWYLRRYSEPTPRKIHRILKQAASMNENSLPTQHFDTKIDAVLWRTTALVAATLLIVGVWSVTRRRKAGQANPDMSQLQFVGWDFETGKAALTNVLSLGLPIYAAMKVGGVMVALSLALTYSTGLPTIFEEREIQANQSRDRIGQKKATLVILAVFVITCVLQLDVPSDVTPMKGYAALAVSIFLLRPPFAKAYDATQVASRQNDDSSLTFTGLIQSLLDQQASAVLPGPLNSTPADIRLTLLSGASLAAVSLIWGTFNRSSSLFGMVDIIYLIGTASSFAAGLVISSPMSLRTRQKKGFIVTCAMLVFFGALPHAESSRIDYLVRAIFGGLSYFASVFDDSKLYMLETNERNGHSNDESSRFTRFLLQRGESFPVLYSILSERDSRRIFYFMM
jgi:solute carrier family 30 (zinc transporter), member 5/7